MFTLFRAYPDVYLFEFPRDEYIAVIPEPERHDMILAYHAQLNSADKETRLKAAKAWAKWECVFLSSPVLLDSYDV